MSPTEPDAGVQDQLISGLDSSNADEAEVASFLSNPLTLVEQLPTPFLHRYRIYRVMPRHLSRPILRHVAGGEDLKTYLLGPDSGAISTVLGAEGSVLETAESAVGCAELLIEIGSGPGLQRVVRSADEIPYRENISAEELEAKKPALSELVRPPAAERDGDRWTVTMWLARDNAIQEEVLVLGREGELVSHEVRQRHELPLIQVV